MAEKADAQSDTVSLPPQYAPSEAYTESPPPAYRKDPSRIMAITRMVCVTLLAASFVIGVFILASTWLHTRAANCQTETIRGDDINIKSASFLDSPVLPAEPLIKEKEEVVLQEIEEEPKLIIPPEEVLNAALEEIEEVENIEQELEKEQEELQKASEVEEEIEEIQKKVRIPIDMLFGNPALMGRNVNCKVDRRRQMVGPGIMNQAIIVTCDDVDDREEEPERPIAVGPMPPRGPLSLIGPIMKLLSARAQEKARIEQIMKNDLDVPSPPRPPVPPMMRMPFGMPPPPEEITINQPPFVRVPLGMSPLRMMPRLPPGGLRVSRMLLRPKMMMRDFPQDFPNGLRQGPTSRRDGPFPPKVLRDFPVVPPFVRMPDLPFPGMPPMSPPQAFMKPRGRAAPAPVPLPVFPRHNMPMHMMDKPSRMDHHMPRMIHPQHSSNIIQPPQLPEIPPHPSNVEHPPNFPPHIHLPFNNEGPPQMHHHNHEHHPDMPLPPHIHFPEAPHHMEGPPPMIELSKPSEMHEFHQNGPEIHEVHHEIHHPPQPHPPGEIPLQARQQHRELPPPPPPQYQQIHELPPPPHPTNFDADAEVMDHDQMRRHHMLVLN